jgi:hypothetical protein
MTNRFVVERRFMRVGWLGDRCAMDIPVHDRRDVQTSGAAADEGMPRWPLWPVLVIAFAISATLLWTAGLLWLLSRMIFLLVSR